MFLEDRALCRSVDWESRAILYRDRRSIDLNGHHHLLLSPLNSFFVDHFRISSHEYNEGRKKKRIRSCVTKYYTLFVLGLISINIYHTVDVIFPMAFLRPESDPLMSLLSLIFSIYLASCSSIHYYLACTTPPGSPSEPINQPHKSFSLGRSSCARGLRRWLPKGQRIGPVKQEMIEQYRLNINRHCLKCLKLGIKGIDGRGPIKPERAHHCRVCGVCQLKYDHHCPWINQCVGLRNERFFLLFLFYMSVSCAWVVFWGWASFIESVDFSTSWPFWSPRVFVILTWVLALAIGLTIGIMFGWQLLLIAKGETTVESSDNEYYHQLFSQRGQKYMNPFDLGVRRNLEQFFNIGQGGRWRWYTVLLPIKIPPSNDGWNWPKRAGWENQVLNLAEELTDEEDEEDDHSSL
ncbi:hypothetical protein PGT21_000956 [Puccinia graminis f. sp. tritici]|uniref:Palmitoyltransferase n=1 Tax=Puccinia graminis f. sp. tritici TaxID=56615 RepID=A0A5B0MYA0_PUCGR|nr:hypothetical protein PGTUg99_030349 [Puccinia graminis f. sp. tritici]KAA1085013.1 hypothetical protein PGT21_000956 [Puccinia graminis f. sp. tritici]